MDIKEIRRQNLRLLSEQYGGQRALAEAADLAPNQLNHIIGPNPIRNLGEQLARKIETNLGIPSGHLDTPIPHPVSDISLNTAILGSQDSIYLRQLSIDVDSSTNSYKFSYVGEGCAFTQKWALNMGFSPINIFEYKVESENMAPFMKHGDFVVVDTSYTRIDDGSVYLFVINGSVIIKRIFMLLNGNIKIANDNQNKIQYPDIDVPFEQFSQIKLIGKIISHQRNLPL